MHYRLLPKLERWQVLDGGRVRYLQVCIMVTCFECLCLPKSLCCRFDSFRGLYQREEMPARNVHLEMFATEFQQDIA